MSNRGILAGATSPGWRTYVPLWRSANFSGSAPTTLPDLGNGTAIGRYLRFPSGLVIAQLSLTFGSTTAFGSAADFYQFGLPYPGSRSNSAADLPIGNGFATQGNSASPQITQMVIPTLADPASTGQGGRTDEDNWAQGFCQRLIATGVSGDANSPAFTSGATSVTVTHGLGATGGYVPSIYDIDVVATNSPSTNPRAIYVNTITATTFQINVGASSTTTPLTYAWKIRAEPNNSGPGILVGPSAPWVWASGHSIALQCMYEARR